ncbi:hypothetical protein D8B26_007019 [Coccidioides posadasii str. Silveira]|uniref:Wax synthase domain-containing protein n=2 Tax=Coccidioides posadasii TaxID=199306 RepID=E9DH29_COCPS|nr:conserved hypothetical protein [Coccidioides posadasii str. Silveira]KMM71129.1 hypothetical protein CPAG_07436 [Coccidioides posadasii RMSCC 3488]QVM12389.1 hypothetical protein D8B26_007019 [Coccidioides posadasii str. Silveira]
MLDSWHQFLFSIQSMTVILLPILSFLSGWGILTLPSSYAKRLLPPVLLGAFIAFRRQNEFSSNRLLNELFGRLMMLWMMYMPFLVYIKGYDGESHRLFGSQHKHALSSWPSLAKSSARRALWRSAISVLSDIFFTFNARKACALKMLFNGRGINTAWQVHALPSPRSSMTLSPASHINPCLPLTVRWQFVSRRSIALLTKLIIWLIWSHYSPYLVLARESDYLPEKQILLRRLLLNTSSRLLGTPNPYFLHPVTIHEIKMRIWIVADNNIQSIVILKGFHDICALLFVGLGFDVPDEWPPFFGSIQHAFTVRGYWSGFWHLLMHRGLSAYATLVLHHVLRIRRRSLFSRLVHGLLVFLISGFCHAVMHNYTMPGCNKMPVIIFYALQPVALTIEAVVQIIWKTWRSRHLDSFPKTKSEGVMLHSIGYLWVILWFTWSEPKSILAVNFELSQRWARGN